MPGLTMPEPVLQPGTLDCRARLNPSMENLFLALLTLLNVTERASVLTVCKTHQQVQLRDGFSRGFIALNMLIYLIQFLLLPVPQLKPLEHIASQIPQSLAAHPCNVQHVTPASSPAGWLGLCSLLMFPLLPAQYVVKVLEAVDLKSKRLRVATLNQDITEQ